MLRWPTPLPRAAVLGAAGAFIAAAVSLVALPAPAPSLVSDVAQVLAAGWASVSTARHARGCADSRRRLAWTLLSAGCASWCLGQASWTWAAARSAAVPFPSLADVGFVGFALLAVLALLLYPADGGSSARWRRAWDAVMATGAVGLVSWRTTVGAVGRRRQPGRPGRRPATDLPRSRRGVDGPGRAAAQPNRH